MAKSVIVDDALYSGYVLQRLISAPNNNTIKKMNQRDKLQSEMTRTGTTQKELAEFLKIRPWTISDYLRGVTPWNADNYEKAINYLKSKPNV